MDVGPSIEELFRSDYLRLVQALSVAAGSPEAAADAVQDAFVQANRHWHRVGRYEDPAAWLRRVAVNRLHNQHRGDARRRRTGARVPAPGPTELGAVDAAVDLRTAITNVPGQQRLVVSLHYLLDLSVAEVARAMGLAEGTVKSHLHDARRSLSRAMEVRDDV